MELQTVLRKSTAFYLIITAAGGVLGSFIFSYCQNASCVSTLSPPGFDQQMNSLMRSVPEYFTWFFSIILITVLSVLMAHPLWISLRQFRLLINRRKVIDLGLSTAILLILFAVPDQLFGKAINENIPIYLFNVRVLILTIIVSFSLTPAIYGIWMIREDLDASYRALAEGGEAGQMAYIAKHLRSQDLSQQYLGAISLIIGLVTLSTGAQRATRIASGMNPEALPYTLILTYGLYFTIIIAIIYAPTFLSLYSNGRRLRDQIYPLDTVEKFSEITEKRKAFEENLKLNVSIEQALRTGLVILSPLLTGVVSTLLSG